MIHQSNTHPEGEQQILFRGGIEPLQLLIQKIPKGPLIGLFNKEMVEQFSDHQANGRFYRMAMHVLRMPEHRCFFDAFQLIFSRITGNELKRRQGQEHGRPKCRTLGSHRGKEIRLTAKAIGQAMQDVAFFAIRTMGQDERPERTPAQLINRTLVASC